MQSNHQKLIRTVVILFLSFIFMPSIRVNAKASEDEIVEFVDEVCDEYDISPYFVRSLIYQESRFDEKAKNGSHLGLMQINPSFQKERMKKLECSDLLNYKENILVGVDYLYELFEEYEDPSLVLMVYNMGAEKAIKIDSKGGMTNYASDILERASELEENYIEEVKRYARKKPFEDFIISPYNKETTGYYS